MVQGIHTLNIFIPSYETYNSSVIITCFIYILLHMLKVSATGACALAEGQPPHIQSTASDGAAVRRVTLCDRKQQVPTLAHLYWYAHQLNNRGATKLTISTWRWHSKVKTTRLYLKQCSVKFIIRI